MNSSQLVVSHHIGTHNACGLSNAVMSKLARRHFFTYRIPGIVIIVQNPTTWQELLVTHNCEVFLEVGKVWSDVVKLGGPRWTNSNCDCVFWWSNDMVFLWSSLTSFVSSVVWVRIMLLALQCPVGSSCSCYQRWCEMVQQIVKAAKTHFLPISTSLYLTVHPMLLFMQGTLSRFLDVLEKNLRQRLHMCPVTKQNWPILVDRVPTITF